MHSGFPPFLLYARCKSGKFGKVLLPLCEPACQVPFGWALSDVRTSMSVSVRPHIDISDISEISGPIAIKYYLKHHLDGGRCNGLWAK